MVSLYDVCKSLIDIALFARHRFCTVNLNRYRPSLLHLRGEKGSGFMMLACMSIVILTVCATHDINQVNERPVCYDAPLKQLKTSLQHPRLPSSASGESASPYSARYDCTPSTCNMSWNFKLQQAHAPNLMQLAQLSKESSNRFMMLPSRFETLSPFCLPF